MKTLALALATAAALGLAATFGSATPAKATVIAGHGPAYSAGGDVVPAHWYRRHYYRHHHRHHRHCWWFWRHHHRVLVCR